MKSEKKQKRKRIKIRRPVPFVEVELEDEPEWEPLFAAFQDTAEFMLDLAARLASAFPEDAEAVERVRTFVRARLAGRHAPVSLDDVLLTFGLLIAAFGRDLESIAEACAPFVESLRFPSATEFQPRVPRRFHHPFS